MRMLFAVLTMLLVVGIVGFLVTNPYTTVPIRVWNTTYAGVWVGYLVITAVLVGIVFIGIIALAEGAFTRLENRRLRREIHKLETEVNYFRTQPSVHSPRESSATAPVVAEESPVEVARAPEPNLASAPVYRSGVDDVDAEDAEDDPYSGGRAV